MEEQMRREAQTLAKTLARAGVTAMDAQARGSGPEIVFDLFLRPRSAVTPVLEKEVGRLKPWLVLLCCEHRGRRLARALWDLERSGDQASVRYEALLVEWSSQLRIIEIAQDQAMQTLSGRDLAPSHSPIQAPLSLETPVNPAGVFG